MRPDGKVVYRPRRPWPTAQGSTYLILEPPDFLRRLLHIDALACPRCSTTSQSVPMLVLAFLTDPEVVGRILRHLDLPVQATSLAPVRWAEVGEAQGELGFELEQREDSFSEDGERGGDDLWDGDSDCRPP